MLKYNRIFILSKILLLIFLLLYTAPIFFYKESIDIGILIFLIITYLLSFLFLLFIRSIKFYPKLNMSSFGRSKFLIYSILILLLYFLIYTQTKENYIAPFNRSTRDSDFIQGNLYVVVDILIKAIFCKLIFGELLKKEIRLGRRNIIFLLIIFALIFDIVYLGARRTSVFIIMASLWSIVPRITLNKYYLVIGSLLFLGIFNFLISGSRELVYAGFTDLNLSQVIDASLYSNEYQLVSDNFLRYKNYAEINGFGFGISIITFPLTFIPRFLWTNKPLTIDKITEIFPNLIGELYYNFGFFSIIFLIVYFMFILYIIKKNTIYSMVVFSLIPELFRTNVSTLMFTLFLYYFFFKVLSLK
jgi:hypothetical protein